VSGNKAGCPVAPHRSSSSPANRAVADRDETVRPAAEHVGDDPQAPVLGDDEVERLVADALLQRLGEVRVDVDVAHVGDGELDLVLAAVEDRDVVAAVGQALHDERPGRPGASDDQRARLPHLVPSPRPDRLS
jgi:hypothetical protein